MPAIYLAAPLGQYASCEQLATGLRAAGHHVCSTWHATVAAEATTATIVDPEDEDARAGILAANLRDLDNAQILVALTHAGTPRSTYIEMGHAIADCQRVIWVHGVDGAGRALFDSHQFVTRVRADASKPLLDLVLLAIGTA